MSLTLINRRLVAGLALLAAFNLGLFVRPFVDQARKPGLFALLETTLRISQTGIAEAPRVYVSFDPYCSHCHGLYAQLAKRVETGEVQVEWVPVAFMHGDSAPVAAEMLSATDPSIALSRWFGAELGTSPVVPKGSNPKEIEERVTANTTLIRGLVGRDAAPAVFYRDQSGAPRLMVGAPVDIEAWLKGIS